MFALQNCCRICLVKKTDEEFEHIYDESNELLELGRIYEELLHLTIAPDETPQYFCNYCSLQLKLFHKFRIEAVESYNAFMKTKEEHFIKVEEEMEDEDVDVEVNVGEEENDDENESRMAINATDVIDEGTSDTITHYNIPLEIEDNDDFEDVQYFEEYLSDDDEEKEINTKKASKIEPTKRNRKKLNNENEYDEFVPYACVSCGENFNTKTALGSHRKEFHPRIKYECKLCSKFFYSDESLQAHIKIHNGLPAYQCQECVKTFKQKSHFSYHMLGHRNERNVQCHLCGKSFLSKSDLGIHLRVHNDERRYECDICGKRFRANTHMTNHRYSHFEKQLECSICLQKYSSPNTLRTHIKAVHKGECPYECEICQRKFKRKHHLKAHHKTHLKKGTTKMMEHLKNR